MPNLEQETQETKFNLKREIIAGTQYVSGYENTEDKYVISASMVGNDPLQNYLTIIHGKQVDVEISDATLGTIFHLGMEELMVRRVREANSPVIGVEKSMHMELPNGWIMSGTADLVTKQDAATLNIHDYKLTKTYALKMLKSSLSSHNYSKQMRVLKTLLKNEVDNSVIKKYKNINMKIEIFVKDSKAVNFEPVLTTVDVPNANGADDAAASEVLIAEVVQITDSLQSYIEGGTIPPICEDRWPRKVKDKVIPTRCAFYCSHGKAGLCPHYNPSTRQEATRLANW